MPHSGLPLRLIVTPALLRASSGPASVPYPGRRRVASRLRASLAPRPASPQPQPRLSPSLARLSPRPRAFGLEQDITRPACLWAREGVWATRITSAKPAAAPHPAPPPRLLLTDLTRQDLPSCLIPACHRDSLSPLPDSAPHPAPPQHPPCLACHLARVCPVSWPASASPARPVSAPSPPCHPSPPLHFLVSMLMHLYTAGALQASRQPNIGRTSCVVWLPSSKLISLKGEMRPPCVAGAAPTGEEVRNETSTPCAIISRSAILVYAVLRSGAQFYAAVRSGAQFYAAVRSGCAANTQWVRSHCAVGAQWVRSGAQPLRTIT